MNVIDKIKSLFAGDGDEGDKINVLAERRAALAQRRDRIYEDIGKLEQKDAQLVKEGKAAKAAKSQIPLRRLASQLLQLRKDIGRQNTSAPQPFSLQARALRTIPGLRFKFSQVRWKNAHPIPIWGGGK